jgi:hypothetical protein
LGSLVGPMRTAAIALLLAGCIGPKAAPTETGSGEIHCFESPLGCKQQAERRCPKGFDVLESDKGVRSTNLGLKDPNAPPVYVNYFTLTIRCH